MPGLGYANQVRLRLQTASEGSSVWTLGWTETFTPKIEGITPQFRCQAAVADRLSEDVNLGSGFLQRILTLGMEIQLQFHTDGVSLQVENKIVRLKGKGATEKVEGIQPWYDDDLI